MLRFRASNLRFQLPNLGVQVDLLEVFNPQSMVGRWESPMIFDSILCGCFCILRSVGESSLWFSISCFVDVPAFSGGLVKAACDFRYHCSLMFLHSPVSRWELPMIFDFNFYWCSCILRSVAESCLWLSISFVMMFLHSLVGRWKQPVIFDFISRWCSCIPVIFDFISLQVDLLEVFGSAENPLRLNSK